MRTIRISDMTMAQSGKGISISFREKIEMAKLLDSLVDTDYGLRFAAATLTAIPLLIIFFHLVICI